MVPNWLKLANNLEVREQDILQIRSDSILSDPDMKAHEALKTWHCTNSYKATYKKLIEVSLRQGDSVLASKICSILKGEVTCLQCIIIHVAIIIILTF